MHDAIELGKRIGAMISAICESTLYTYAFDTMAHEITARGKDLAAWERAFHGITANGSTSCGVALKYLRLKKQYVEQIIIITDEQQNTPPPFVPALQEYRKAMQADPSVVIVRTSGREQLRRAGVPARKCAGRRLQFCGRLLLAAKPGADAFASEQSWSFVPMEIMDYPLPKRKSA